MFIAHIDVAQERSMAIVVDYKLVLSDPPWLFKNWSADAPKMTHDRTRGANKWYPTENVEDICKLVPPTEKDAILLIWGLSSHLKELIQVTEAWGFTLKTKAWSWVKMTKNMEKPRIGMGYWTRQATEDCWLATKGKPKAPLYRGEPAVIVTTEWLDYPMVFEDTLLAPKQKRHSQKPIEQYAKIDRLFPDLYPRLEMFAREKQEGWDVFGNEVKDSIEL